MKELNNRWRLKENVVEKNCLSQWDYR